MRINNRKHRIGRILNKRNDSVDSVSCIEPCMLQQYGKNPIMIYMVRLSLYVVATSISPLQVLCVSKLRYCSVR